MSGRREYEAQRLTAQLEGWRRQLSRASRLLAEAGVTREASDRWARVLLVSYVVGNYGMEEQVR
jgi:hypothetical protein